MRFTPNPIYVEGVVGQPEDLIPGYGPSGGVDEILERLLFRSLFIYDSTGKIIPDLVDSYSISKDGKIYSLTLKEANWRDDTPITASDVAFTFTQNPAFSNVTVEQEGERQIRFILKNPLSSFLDVLTEPVGPANFRSIPTNLLGSSDFFITRVTKESGKVKEIGLRTKGDAVIKELVFRFFTTENDLIAAALRGEVQGFSLEDDFSGESFNLYKTSDFSRYFALFFNLEERNPLLGDKSFRSAAARKTPLVKGAQVKGPFSGTWAEGDLPFPSYTEGALKQFGGNLTITVPTTNTLPETAYKIADAWSRELGVEVSIKEVSASLVDDILARRDFEVLILGQEVSRDPDRYNLWHSTQKEFPGRNVSGYADPRGDKALEEGRKVLNPAERKVHYTNFQRLFIEDSPAIFIYHPALDYWVSKKFTGIDLSHVFSPEDRFWNFADWRLDFEAGE